MTGVVKHEDWVVAAVCAFVDDFAVAVGCVEADSNPRVAVSHREDVGDDCVLAGLTVPALEHCDVSGGSSGVVFDDCDCEHCGRYWCCDLVGLFVVGGSVCHCDSPVNRWLLLNTIIHVGVPIATQNGGFLKILLQGLHRARTLLRLHSPAVTLVSSALRGRSFGRAMPIQEARMPKYKVTGGDDGESGIEYSGQRYEAGATVDMPAKKADWMVDIGILEPVGKVTAARDEDE